jgi:hypothetical protein
MRQLVDAFRIVRFFDLVPIHELRRLYTAEFDIFFEPVSERSSSSDNPLHQSSDTPNLNHHIYDTWIQLYPTPDEYSSENSNLDIQNGPFNQLYDDEILQILESVHVQGERTLMSSTNAPPALPYL